MTAEMGLNIVRVAIWDMLLDPETHDKVGFKSKVELDRFFTILHPVSRCMFLFHCLYQAMVMAEKKPADLYLIDSYWYKYYATEVAHGADPDVITHLTKIFPEPGMVFYLDVDVDETTRRKQKFSGYESGFAHDADGFVAFQKAAHGAFAKIRGERKWIIINARRSIDEIENEILHHIKEALS